MHYIGESHVCGQVEEDTESNILDLKGQGVEMSSGQSTGKIVDRNKYRSSGLTW